MSLKTRWLLSMLSVVLVGMALTTLISSRISYYGTERSAYEWLSASQRRMIPTFHQQLFIRLEGQAQLLARLPAFSEDLVARPPSELPAHLGSLWNQPGNGFFWGVVAADGEVLAASLPASLPGGATKKALPGRECLTVGLHVRALSSTCHHLRAGDPSERSTAP